MKGARARGKFRVWLASLCFAVAGGGVSAHAATWSGWSSAIRGNLRSVSMGGANLGLADDFFGAIENPAGPAMTVGGVGLIAAQNRLQDGYLSTRSDEVVSSTLGVASSLYPWGFSFGFWSPNAELGLGLQDELTVREFSFAISRLFFANRLSIGFAPVLGYVIQDLNGEHASSLGLGASAGVLYRFPKRWLVGAGFHLPIRYQRLAEHEVQTPGRIGLGIGYVPNRFFRASIALRWIDAEPGTLTFSSPDRVGRRTPAWQPHLGASYQLVHLRKFRATVFGGTYYEPAHFSDSEGRIHGTFGIEVHPWFMIFAAGADLSTAYRNYVGAVGIDAGALLQSLRIIPRAVPAPPGGILPNPFQVSDDWLIRTLQDDPENSFQELGPSPAEIQKGIEKIPGNFEEKARGAGEDLRDFSEDLKELTSPFQ